ALGKAFDRLLREDVDAAVDPVRDPATFAETLDDVAVAQIDDAERRFRPRHSHRRRAARLPVAREQGTEVDVDQLVAVERVDVALLAPLARGELDSPSATQTLGLLCNGDLCTETAKL